MSKAGVVGQGCRTFTIVCTEGSLPMCEWLVDVFELTVEDARVGKCGVLREAYHTCQYGSCQHYRTR